MAKHFFRFCLRKRYVPWITTYTYTTPIKSHCFFFLFRWKLPSPTNGSRDVKVVICVSSRDLSALFHLAISTVRTGEKNQKKKKTIFVSLHGVVAKRWDVATAWHHRRRRWRKRCHLFINYLYCTLSGERYLPSVLSAQGLLISGWRTDDSTLHCSSPNGCDTLKLIFFFPQTKNNKFCKYATHFRQLNDFGLSFCLSVRLNIILIKLKFEWNEEMPTHKQTVAPLVRFGSVSLNTNLTFVVSGQYSELKLMFSCKCVNSKSRSVSCSPIKKNFFEK